MNKDTTTNIKLSGKTKHGSMTYVRPTVKIGRNDPCYCGSGIKYKNCHLVKQVIIKTDE